jgi:hypothetical protein
VIAAPTGPVPAAPRRAARRTAALALAVVTLVAGAASGAWILAAKGAPRAQGAGVVAVAPAVAAAPVVAHTHSSGQQIFSEDVVESLADAARSAEPSAPVVLARRPPRATTVEQRFARTLPRAVDAGVAAAPVAQSAPQVVVGAVASSGGPPTGGRPSRCSDGFPLCDADGLSLALDLVEVDLEGDEGEGALLSEPARGGVRGDPLQNFVCFLYGRVGHGSLRHLFVALGGEELRPREHLRFVSLLFARGEGELGQLDHVQLDLVREALVVVHF